MSRRLEWAGASFSMPARDIDAVKAEGRQALREYVRDAGQQALEHLRQAVGGIPLRSEPIVRFDGPTDDALQGWIYVLSIAAQVDVDELPAGSTMRAAWDRHGVLTTEPGVIA